MLKHKGIAKETLFVAASLTCMVLIIAVTSFANAGLSLEVLLSDVNISNAIVNAAITVFGTVAAVPSGMVNTKQRRNPDGSLGRYLQEFNEYNTVRSRIEPKRLSFNQWHSAQHLKEQHRKCVEYLLSKNILQAEDILKLTKEHVKQLTSSQMFEVDGTRLYFKSLTEEQVKACLKVMTGSVIVHKLPDSYFLSVDGKGTKTFYDQAYYETRDARLLLTTKLVSKIFIGFVITCIFTGLVINFNSADSTATYILQAIINTVARIFNAVSSTLWGYLLGQEMAYSQCYYINGRTQFLKLFESDVNFKTLDVQLQAKYDYESSKGVQYETEKPQNSVLDSNGELD